MFYCHVWLPNGVKQSELNHFCNQYHYVSEIFTLIFGLYDHLSDVSPDPLRSEVTCVRVVVEEQTDCVKNA